MGRQTNFFMNKEDLRNFRQFIKEQYDIVIEDEPGKDRGPIITMPEEELNRFTYYIYNPSFKLVFEFFKHDRKNTMAAIEKFPLKDREELIKQAEERFQRIGYVKDTNSEVVEFLPCKVIEQEKRITEGRIWVELYDYDENGQKFKRSDLLESMYVKYAKYIKKNFKLDEKKYYYIGPGAFQLYKEGWWMGDERNKDERYKRNWK